jgi:hypothetical protein
MALAAHGQTVNRDGEHLGPPGSTGGSPLGIPLPPTGPQVSEDAF